MIPGLQLLLSLCWKLNVPAQQVLRFRAKLDELQEQQRQIEEIQQAAGDPGRSPAPSLFSRMCLARPGSCMSLRPVSSVATAGLFSMLNDFSSFTGEAGDDSSPSAVRQTRGKDEEPDYSIEDLLPRLG
ncbi:hypothetical protein RvY_00379 [Ramazzottius varieornatus]|uniref:Uncharacterized protein n=1 Tax=Ramazzottius varieornatus TaxID=947166 RepID=A0A1D1UCK5_RAMVA|nr:hypothetical protein RvY_00379 [Ramazzottius varieornatus]